MQSCTQLLSAVSGWELKAHYSLLDTEFDMELSMPTQLADQGLQGNKACDL